MTDWLLLFVFLTGKDSVRVDSLAVTRHPTQELCEMSGAVHKKQSKLRATFVCFEVARIKK